MFAGINLSIVYSVLASPPPGLIAAGISYQLFDTSEEALAEILKSNPTVVAFGEYHPQRGYPKAESPASRFLKLLPQFGGRKAELVIEVLETTGECGAVEARVVRQVEDDIRRPSSSETETARIIVKARELGISDHDLRLSCEDYQRLLQPDGQIDYVRLLTKIAGLIQERAQALLRSGSTVVIYGGAIHNDLYPSPENRPYSFGPSLHDSTAGKYVEVDLVVPEYIARMPELKKATWYPIFKRHASRGKVLLINPRPNYFVIIFPRK